MENYKSKIVTAEAAVAAAVKDGDWVDYGFGGGFPELLDKALAARKGHLKDVKIRDGLVIRPAPSRLLRLTRNRKASPTTAGISVTTNGNSKPAAL